MRDGMTIGEVSRDTGVSIRTIRFYEAEGVVPAPARTDAGYRVYAPKDVRRLRLVRNARVLGLGLGEIRALVEQAFASECHSFAPQLRELIAGQREEVKRLMSDLRALLRDLDELEKHVSHAACATDPGQLVADCDYCPLIDEEGERCDEASGRAAWGRQLNRISIYFCEHLEMRYKGRVALRHGGRLSRGSRCDRC